MAIHTQNIGKVSEGAPVSWDSKDALLYALSVGAGARDQTANLAFTTENSRDIEQSVLPTFAVLLGGSGGSMDELGDFKLSSILHGGQAISVYRTLATSGTVIPRSFMSAVYDKGKNAVIELTTDLLDAETRETVAASVTTMIIRGEGGFGSAPAPSDGWELPERPADLVDIQKTTPDQALLYRLNGDRNPLHSDPALAAMVGFEKPILHGLCTMGFAGRAVLEGVADSDADAFGSLNVRFAAPVVPGDELTTSIWKTDAGAVFQTRIGDTVVLDRGTFVRRDADTPRDTQLAEAATA
ncbi:MaoC/PaaZ C-terminal domain-containing protein [Arthrobacter sp. zg-Y1219]|uniref:MaoC/PaaZ C-terminal domain-containing protein n=1 Tax=Arthrobacter sp. zg-Y1219 TaxID=3049067 RepID=UPI0024C24E57|nr:MaoC/PaaZ C-terminal domain-containing protein [Arthrobacter sp. zg-Y1219]MDK1359967.1 MaoC/PaaZ C-terminal domain-containing protein [Arthrobacter sp. zg-Y1219]